jgi:Holliday junction resolvase
MRPWLSRKEREELAKLVSEGFAAIGQFNRLVKDVEAMEHRLRNLDTECKSLRKVQTIMLRNEGIPIEATQ